ncbi:SUF system Fe-S cluster assembly regulator [Oecophyllibacter saccharovorans]|uniref:SUF system Fe-S cluster assembly regulator n=1 Tax=Oecophyllibacter saccharovorans TaxID=2558360 RepID=A0A506UR01_9PROT|nr:SUF system Fe-S cluster assembly regulator [Oecophyllibacter saccharovorans]TPW34833.1 SUF system Fe-S cluster assembly regulator [Oecophyllibacter saccharovorans]TPW35770.1 SUF system Fe-S cluster assembly regulator [Oecophyllibacter saccharovorans]
MLRLSKLADYAAVLLVRLGKLGELTTAVALAQETGMPEPTVAKLLKALAANGLVVSFRGARGGYRLGEPLEQISIARVITAIDGPISITACCDGYECAHGAKCGLSGQWDKVNQALRTVLESMTLADMGAGKPQSPGGICPSASMLTDLPVGQAGARRSTGRETVEAEDISRS